jgi:hypothetical protein
MMRITWSYKGRKGEGYVFSADDAARLIEEAVRAAYPDPADTELLAHILWSVVGPLRTSMVTSGEQAVRQGGTWAHSSQGISVTLCPARGVPPTVGL